MSRRFPLLIAVLLLVNPAAFAAAVDDLFATANKAYEQGKFREAALLYEQVITNGHATAAAWFNLGNARFKAGELGRSIAAWRSAERLTPRDTALRANLEFARRKAAGGAESTASPLIQLLSYFTTNEWTIAASLLLAGFFLALAYFEWRTLSRPVRRPGLLLMLMGGCGVVTAAAAITSYAQSYSHREVVAIRQTATRYGPLEESQIAFQATDGQEFKVRDFTPGWVQVQSGSGKIGWMKKGDVEFVSPAKLP